MQNVSTGRKEQPRSLQHEPATIVTKFAAEQHFHRKLAGPARVHSTSHHINHRKSTPEIHWTVVSTSPPVTPTPPGARRRAEPWGGTRARGCSFEVGQDTYRQESSSYHVGRIRQKIVIPSKVRDYNRTRQDSTACDFQKSSQMRAPVCIW